MGIQATTLESVSGQPHCHVSHIHSAVHKAIGNFNSIIAPALKESGVEVTEQVKVDELLLMLDGTDNKSRLGANAILAASTAYVKASASYLVRHWRVGCRS